MSKEVTVKGPLRDMSDVLAIARMKGRKLCGCERVNVKPFIEIRNNKDYIVKVQPE